MVIEWAHRSASRCCAAESNVGRRLQGAAWFGRRSEVPQEILTLISDSKPAKVEKVDVCAVQLESTYPAASVFKLPGCFRR